MRLLVDIGNSRIKAALQQGDVLQPLPAVAYSGADWVDGLAVWGLTGEVQSCWVASVGHADVCQALAQWLQSHHGLQARFAESTAQACGVTNAYGQPGHLGVDRWLGMIAAHHMGGPAVIVSAGTAATIDAVNGQGQHLGGLITPGLNTQRKAMLDHTQVRADTNDDSLGLLGDSTDACVTYGTLHAVLGYIEHTVAKLEQRDGQWRHLITGGDAGLLQQHLQGDWQHAPHLVLEGLAILAETSTH